MASGLCVRILILSALVMLVPTAHAFQRLFDTEISHITSGGSGEICPGRIVTRRCITDAACRLVHGCECRGYNPVGNGRLECTEGLTGASPAPPNSCEFYQAGNGLGMAGNRSRSYRHLPAPTPDDCLDLARLDPMAHAVDFEHNTCFLYNLPAVPFSRNSSLFWWKICPGQPDNCPLVKVEGEFSGNRSRCYRKITVGDSGTCVEACDLDPVCQAVDFADSMCCLFPISVNPLPAANSMLWRRSCPGDRPCLLVQIQGDLQGNHSHNYRELNGTSVDGCLEACDLDPMCQAVDYIDGTCCLYSAPVPPFYRSGSRFWQRECGPPEPPCPLVQVDGPLQGDHRQKYRVVNGTTASQCEAECASDPVCQAADFANDTCYLYSVRVFPFHMLGSRFWRRNCGTPERPCPLRQLDGHLQGNHSHRYRVLNLGSASLCLDECDLDPLCQAADFNGTCSLYSVPVTPFASPRFSFWRRECGETGLNCRMGHTIYDRRGDPAVRAGSMGTSNFGQCLVYCMSVPRCVAVDYQGGVCTYYHQHSDTEHSPGSKFARKVCRPCPSEYCELGADPHVQTFNGFRACINFPCLHRLARFVTDNGYPGDQHVTCDVDVRAWTEAVQERGRFFAAGVDIHLRLQSSAGQENVNVWMWGYSYNNGAGVAQYTLHARGTNVEMMPWGTTLFKFYVSVGVFVYIDSVDNFLVFYIPACCTRIKFRPHNMNQTEGAQTQTPGITILAPRDAQWDTAESEYPHSLCGTPLDEGHIIRQSAAQDFLDNHNQGVLHAVLTQNIQPQDLNANQFFSSCTEAIQDFNDAACLENERKDAVRVCGEILLSRRLLKCQWANDLSDIMNNYVRCQEIVCFGSGDGSALFSLLLSACAEAMTAELAAFLASNV